MSFKALKSCLEWITTKLINSLYLNINLWHFCTAIPPAQRSTTTRTTTTPRPVVTHNATIRVQQKHLPSVNFSSNRVPAASEPDTKVKYPWYHSMGPNLITTPRPVPTRPTVFQSTTAQTPYWWRPHFTKLPIIKNDRGSADQGYSIKKKGNVAIPTLLYHPIYLVTILRLALYSLILFRLIYCLLYLFGRSSR